MAIIDQQAIKFKYRMNQNLAQMVSSTVSGYTGQYLTGIMPAGLTSQLRHSSLFLVCDFSEDDAGVQTYSNPVAIVAVNEVMAAQIYREHFEKPAFILHRIEDDCSKIKVETI